MTMEGIRKARSVRRRPADDKWDLEMIRHVEGVPRDWSGSSDTPTEDREAQAEFDTQHGSTEAEAPVPGAST